MIVKVRRMLRNVAPLRSAFYFFRAVGQRALFKRHAVFIEMEGVLQEHEDPWNYTSSPDEADRFRSAAELLDLARENKPFENAFEVGCSEGFFTEMLAPRCQSLLAVDISQVALCRAQQRCKGQGVRFEQWNLFASPAPANLDLIVVMDVLEYFFRPADVRCARDKLIGALRPGGYLLVGNSRQSEVFETSWWGKWMLRGGKRIAEFIRDHPQLEFVAGETRGIYVNALFRLREKEP
jgi:2-polyprenyl-3-methyl-5-hydroxy-6-metoxy-1,4-benzoquinol methylase